MTDYQIGDFLHRLLVQSVSRDVEWKRIQSCDRFFEYVKMIQKVKPCSRVTALLRMQEAYECGKIDLRDIQLFFSLLYFRYPIWNASLEIDKQTEELWQIFICCKQENFPLFEAVVESLSRNESLQVNAENVRRIFLAYRNVQATPHFHNVALNALQVCSKVEFFEHAIEGLDHPFPESLEGYLTLPFKEQRALLSRAVVLRDRNELIIVSELLQRYQKELPFSFELLELSLHLLEDTQLFFNMNRDENALLGLIFNLLVRLIEEKPYPKVQVLSQAILSLGRIDCVCLQEQYLPGIFTVCQVAFKQREYLLMKSCIQALQLYIFGKQRQDEEIVCEMIKYSENKSLPNDLQREIGKLLSMIPQEKALLRAWTIIHSCAWEAYNPWNASCERMYEGANDMFFLAHRVLHENRSIMEKKILDQLGLCRADLQEKVEEIYCQFKKTPEKFAHFMREQTKLQTLPPELRCYDDLLYLPKNAPLFRGIQERKNIGLPCDPIVDFFEKGIGSVSLLHENAKAGVLGGDFAKLGQFFFTTDANYVHDYQGLLVIVIKGEYVNQSIVKGRVRVETDEDVLNYVIYGSISQEVIERVYVEKELLQQLKILKEADCNDLPSLGKFQGLLPHDLKRFVLSLQQDPHRIFSKIRTLEDFQETTRSSSKNEIVTENSKRLILRELVKKEYFPSLRFSSHL